MSKFLDEYIKRQKEESLAGRRLFSDQTEEPEAQKQIYIDLEKPADDGIVSPQLADKAVDLIHDPDHGLNSEIDQIRSARKRTKNPYVQAVLDDVAEMTEAELRDQQQERIDKNSAAIAKTMETSIEHGRQASERELNKSLEAMGISREKYAGDAKRLTHAFNLATKGSTCYVVPEPNAGAIAALEEEKQRLEDELHFDNERIRSIGENPDKVSDPNSESFYNVQGRNLRQQIKIVESELENLKNEKTGLRPVKVDLGDGISAAYHARLAAEQGLTMFQYLKKYFSYNLDQGE